MDFLSLIMPFYIESIFCFLIILFIYHYLFSVNPKLHNDNFSLTNLALFFLMSIIIILYLLIKDPEIFYYSSRLVSLDLNNLLIKLFLLIQFSFLCFFWPTNKLLANIKTTFKLLILLLFFLLGLCIALDACDLMLLYVGIELSSIPTYILVSNKEYMISIEAGIKFYILSALSSCFFLLGISFIYGLTGSTLYNVLFIYELYAEYYDNYYLYLVLLFIMVIFLFKIGIYPFNFWVTNFNEGASLNIVFFLAIIPKLPYIYILMLLLFNIFNISFTLKLYLTFILMLLSFITIFTSIIEGLSDNHIGRIIGQSSMINMSFIFIVLLCLIETQESYLLFLFMFYLIPTLLLFNLLSLRDINLTKRDFTVINDLFTINPFITSILYFTLISLSGLPFLAGFFGKWFIFGLLIDYNYIITVIFLVIFSIFSTIFYIRLYFYTSSRIRFNNVKIKNGNYIKYLLLSFLNFINISLIFLQEPFIACLFSFFS